MVYQDTPHRDGADRKQMAAILPIDLILFSKPEIGFVDQSGRLQCAGMRFANEITFRQAPEVIVDQGEEAIERGVVAVGRYFKNLREPGDRSSSCSGLPVLSCYSAPTAGSVLCSEAGFRPVNSITVIKSSGLSPGCLVYNDSAGTSQARSLRRPCRVRLHRVADSSRETVTATEDTLRAPPVAAITRPRDTQIRHAVWILPVDNRSLNSDLRQIFIGSGPAEKSRTKAWWRGRGASDQVVRRNSLTFARDAAGYGNVPLWDFNRFSPFARCGAGQGVAVRR